jgi:hypothetical protein
MLPRSHEMQLVVGAVDFKARKMGLGSAASRVDCPCGQRTFFIAPTLAKMSAL